MVPHLVTEIDGLDIHFIHRDADVDPGRRAVRLGKPQSGKGIFSVLERRAAGVRPGRRPRQRAGVAVSRPTLVTVSV